MIENDELIRETQIKDQYGCIRISRDCIITKKEFLECYNEWVVKPSQGTPVSLQTKFHVDYSGATPV